jgi:hypothetical protein
VSDDAVLDFCKVDSNLDTNPKIRKAGFFGSAVFQFILRLNRRLRRDGDVPLSYISAEYVVDQLRVPGDDALDIVHRAIEACVRAELLELDHDQGLARIVGWEQDWGMRAPKPVRERVAAHRERQRQQQPTPAVTRVTPERHSNAIRSEEIRSEEIRGEEKDQSLHSGSDIPPELPDPPAIVGADLGAPPPGIPQPGRGRSAVVALNTDAWRYAALKHAELGLEGSLPWPAMPAGAAYNDLVDRTREVLAMHDPPRFDEARALITRRIDVAFAAAQREQHVKWFTPTRMWDAKSFWRDLEISPAQARAPRSPPIAPPTEPRKIKTLG